METTEQTRKTLSIDAPDVFTSVPLQLNVLLIEDSVVDAKTLTGIAGKCQYHNFQFNRVASLAEARERLASPTYDIIVCDLGLPDSKGIDTLLQVREHSRDIPILVLTGDNEFILGVELLKSGAQEYLVKGTFNSDTLERCVRYAIERHKSAENLQQMVDSLVEANDRYETSHSMLEEVNGLLREEIESRKEIEAALRNAQARSRVLFEEAPVPLWELDCSRTLALFNKTRSTGVADLGEFFKTNPSEVVRCVSLMSTLDINFAALTLFGAASKSELGDKFLMTFTEESFNAVIDCLVLLSQREPVIQTETTVRKLDGQETSILMQWSIAEGHEEDLSRVIFSPIDISERKNIEQQLLQAQKLESIGQLAAGIAHEINTPTQYVSDNTFFLQKAFGGMLKAINSLKDTFENAIEGPLDDEQIKQTKKSLKKAKLDYLSKQVPRALEQSLEGLDRIATIVAAMKEFSHPSEGEKAHVDLGKAIEGTVTVARNEWKYVAEVVTEFDPELPPVPCLRDEFNQVILNTVVNAAHAIADKLGEGASEKGTITINTHLTPPWAEIRISDTGTGIPEKVREKIFDPFFTTKGVGKGTGQGLAISHSVVVDKHQGEIDVESTMGQGTTFIIRLPLEAKGGDK